MVDSTTLAFQTERWSDAVDEIRSLVGDHWTMLALNKESIPLSIDWDAYYKNESLGVLHLLTARGESGILAGYYVSFVVPHPHYKSSLFGLVDAYYIRPEFRGPTTGLEFFEALEEEMRKFNVKCLISTTKLHYDVGAILERCGWKEAGRTFTKVLS